ncbi:neuroblastoma-amplified sequence-like, partial [Aphis craccivora]
PGKFLRRRVAPEKTSRRTRAPRRTSTLNHKYEQKLHYFYCKFCSVDNINCKCNILEKMEVYKYLGITLDYKLKWSCHINNLISNLHVKRYFNIKMKRVIYIALVQSIFSYGIMFWGCTYNTHLEKLKVTINSIIKFLLSKPKYYSTKLIFNELDVQNFDKIFYTNHLFTNVNHDYNTRHICNINIVSNSNTTFGSHCSLNVGSDLCKKLRF